MNDVPAYISVMRFIVKVGALVGAGGFWGMAAALLMKALLNISGDAALLYVGAPVAVALSILIWPKLPKILGFVR